MSQSYDGGEAVLEAIRNLGVDYIISSPGSEWAPVWEALVRQRTEELDGPIYISTLGTKAWRWPWQPGIPGLRADCKQCCYTLV